MTKVVCSVCCRMLPLDDQEQLADKKWRCVNRDQCTEVQPRLPFPETISAAN